MEHLPPKVSSARRPRPPSRVGLAVIVAAGAGIGLLALLGRPERPRDGMPVRSARVRAQAPAATPTATSTSTPTPPPLPTISTGWVEVPVEPTPSPLVVSTSPTAIPVAPSRATPTPTPDLTECLHYTASASQLTLTSGQVLIEVDIENRCGRDLDPLDVWFEARGWRDGALVQTARGHPFEALPRGAHAHLAFDLPGSLTWYDKVDVRPLP